jgi:hypothetical protein
MPSVTITRTGIATGDFLTLDIQELDEPGNGQGVAYDGTYHYFSDSVKIYRYTRNTATGAYTLVDSRTVSGDDPVTKTQINDMDYFDGYLWCGANNFPGTNSGWIVQYNPADLSWVATYDVNPAVNEGGAWRVDPVEGPEFWSVYSNLNYTSRWRIAGGEFVKVADYDLPIVDDWVFAAGTSSIYDGAVWLDDYFICHAKGDGNLQESVNHQETQLHIHYWNGAEFEASNVIFTGVVSAGQGIHWETDGAATLDDVLLIAMRDPQLIVRSKILSLT